MTDPTETDRAIARVRRALAGKDQPELEGFLDDVRVLSDLLSPGVLAIAVERLRQITDEGYTPEHDAGHSPQLFDAAGEYATAASVAVLTDHGAVLPVPFGWPWEAGFWKPSADPIKNARRSGAMLAAGIDSLLAEQGPTKEN